MTDYNFLNEILEKYSEVRAWIDQVALSFNSDEVMLLNKQIKAAEVYTLQTTNCGQERFHDVIKLDICERTDLPIYDAYYGYLNNIRLARQ